MDALEDDRGDELEGERDRLFDEIHDVGLLDG